MGFNEIDAAGSLDLFQALGEAVTYQRCTGEVLSCNVVIDQGVDSFGEVAVEKRTEISILRSDVNAPQRGDTIRTASGTVYVIKDPAPVLTDKLETRVSVK